MQPAFPARAIFKGRETFGRLFNRRGGRVALRLENQAAEVAEVVDVVIQVRDVVGDVLQRPFEFFEADGRKIV